MILGGLVDVPNSAWNILRIDCGLVFVGNWKSEHFFTSHYGSVEPLPANMKIPRKGGCMMEIGWSDNSLLGPINGTLSQCCSE